MSVSFNQSVGFQANDTKQVNDKKQSGGGHAVKTTVEGAVIGAVVGAVGTKMRNAPNAIDSVTLTNAGVTKEANNISGAISKFLKQNTESLPQAAKDNIQMVRLELAKAHKAARTMGENAPAFLAEVKENAVNVLTKGTKNFKGNTIKIGIAGAIIGLLVGLFGGKKEPKAKES